LLFNFLNNILDKNPSNKKRKNTEGVKKRVVKLAPEITTWTINEQDIPVEIHREIRRSWRYSFAKQRLLIRLPRTGDAAFEEKIFAAIRISLEEKTEKKPQLLKKYDIKDYQDGDTFTVGKRSYYLKIELEDRKTHAAKLGKNGVIHISLGHGNTEGVVSQLLSRIVSKDFSAEFSRRVFELNHQYFKKNIKSINFKYNHSNWGSCSSTGNLNFSSRLLFAPDDVQDYVIIHELSHLIELNHSDRFWKWVSDAMPNYKEKEKWLKKNGHLCRF
jgi:predicted metal-dependent hydrolase